MVVVKKSSYDGIEFGQWLGWNDDRDGENDNFSFFTAMANDMHMTLCFMKLEGMGCVIVLDQWHLVYCCQTKNYFFLFKMLHFGGCPGPWHQLTLDAPAAPAEVVGGSTGEANGRCPLHRTAAASTPPEPHCARKQLAGKPLQPRIGWLSFSPPLTGIQSQNIQ